METEIKKLKEDLRKAQSQIDLHSRVLAVIQNLLTKKGFITIEDFRSDVKHNIRLDKRDADFLDIGGVREQRP